IACIAQASIDESSHSEFRGDAAALGATNTIRDGSNDPEARAIFIRNRGKVFVGGATSSLAAKPGSDHQLSGFFEADGLGRLGQISVPGAPGIPAQFVIVHRQIYVHRDCVRKPTLSVTRTPSELERERSRS